MEVAAACTKPFRGREALIEMLDDAVQRPTVEDITGRLKDGLSALMSDRALDLPETLRSCCSDHYARRLLYRSEEHGYVAIAMIWGPQQGTPLHDHDGTWCVEGVLDGEIEVTQYDLIEEAGERCRFDRRDSLATTIGDAGSLIPPFDYHTIRNLRRRESSITVHVYGREMTECTIFQPLEGDWYQRQVKPLSYD